MGFEPNAQKRLQLLWATTRDPTLRFELHSALTAPEEYGMAFVPSAELRRLINSCPSCTAHDAASGREGLCEIHRVRWNMEACMPEGLAEEAQETLDRIMRSVL